MTPFKQMQIDFEFYMINTFEEEFEPKPNIDQKLDTIFLELDVLQDLIKKIKELK